MVAHWDENAKESRNAAFTGLIGAVVWIAIIGVICFYWAGGPGGGEHEAAAPGAAPAAAHP